LVVGTRDRAAHGVGENRQAIRQEILQDEFPGAFTRSWFFRFFGHDLVLADIRRDGPVDPTATVPKVGQSGKMRGVQVLVRLHLGQAADGAFKLEAEQFAFIERRYRCRGDRKSTRLNSSHVKISYA